MGLERRKFVDLIIYIYIWILLPSCLCYLCIFHFILFYLASFYFIISSYSYIYFLSFLPFYIYFIIITIISFAAPTFSREKPLTLKWYVCQFWKRMPVRLLQFRSRTCGWLELNRNLEVYIKDLSHSFLPLVSFAERQRKKERDASSVWRLCSFVDRDIHLVFCFSYSQWVSILYSLAL